MSSRSATAGEVDDEVFRGLPVSRIVRRGGDQDLGVTVGGVDITFDDAPVDCEMLPFLWVKEAGSMPMSAPPAGRTD